MFYFQPGTFTSAHFSFSTSEQCIRTAALQSQIYRQCTQIIAELQKSLQAGGLFAEEGKKWKGSAWSYLSRPPSPILLQPHFITWQMQREMLCYKTSWRTCAGSFGPFQSPDFFCSPANACLEHWSDVQVRGPEPSECLFSESGYLQGWHRLQWGGCLQPTLTTSVGRLSLITKIIISKQ